ncbi:MAG: peptide ABC transporter substrate-binding protein [Firmicutes bacterium]|nr:peptide ABC transporter substrate-binding protein [Bacillota bacterium]
MKKFCLLFICSMLVFTACADKNESQSAIVATQIGEADKMSKKDNKDLTLSMRTAKTLNPLKNEEETVDLVLRIMFEPLIEIDNNYKPSPSIAESWYYTEEGTLLTIKLKSGLTWHDGSAITADDVIYSLNTIRNAPETSIYKKCAESIIRYSKADDLTVNVKFNRSYVGNVYAMSFPVISSQYYGSGANVEFAPMGSGAYKFESYTAAQELRLKASENSFTKKPSIENIIVSITTDSDTDIYTFSQRITDSVIADETILGRFDFDDGSKKYSFTDNYFDFIGFNYDKHMFNDKNIRKAIVHSIPVESIIEAIYLSNAEAALTPLNRESFLWPNDERTEYEYDLSTARNILQTAGYVLNNGSNVREKWFEDGVQTLSFSILVNDENEQRRQMAVKIAEELNSIGFAIAVESVDFETFKSRLENGEYDMFLGGFELSIVPDFGFLYETGSDMNYSKYSNEKIDELIEEYRSSVSESDIKNNMTLLINEIYEELPYIGIVFRKSALFTDERIGGNVLPIQFDAYNNIEEWTIE